MLVSKLAVLALALSPMAANAASTRLLCQSPSGSTEIRFVTGAPGLVTVFSSALSFTVDASAAAPLFTNNLERMNGVTLVAKDRPGTALSFVNIGEGDYGRTVLQASVKLPQPDGKVASGVLGHCTLMPRYGY